LLPGDNLILYTDGVVESLNARREMFGFERFHDTLIQCATSSSESRSSNRPQAIVEEILKAVRRFGGLAEQSDDVTILAIQVEGSHV
jgi:sigma-B regulation protein RsbU (phosphoserine phosphatase)